MKTQITCDLSQKTIDRLNNIPESDRQKLLSRIINNHIENMNAKNHEVRPKNLIYLLNYVQKLRLWYLSIYHHRFDALSGDTAEECIDKIKERYPVTKDDIKGIKRQKKDVSKYIERHRVKPNSC